MEGIDTIWEKSGLIGLLGAGVVWLGKKLWSMIQARDDEKSKRIESLTKQLEEMQKLLIEVLERDINGCNDGKKT